MRKILTLAVGFSIAGICMSKEFDPFQGERPIAVLVQSDPWAMVVGSDTPHVAIYENGDVIVIKKIDGQETYHKIILDEQELDAVRARLDPLLSLEELKPRYSMRPNWTDQPTAKIYVRSGDREVATSVYGMTCSGLSSSEDSPLVSESSASTVPGRLVETHRLMCNLDFQNSKAWEPEYIEVMLWDYSYAPEASVQWPEAWPSLDSDRAIKRNSMYSLFMDGSSLSALRKFLSTRNAKGAVEISEKKMAVSYRFVFPGEPAWRDAFRTAAESAGAE
jgi:hypothetical protein